MRIEITPPDNCKDTKIFYEDGYLNIISKKWIEEHDKQIRAEVIEESVRIVNNIIEKYCKSVKCTKECQDCEIGCMANKITEQLKEQKC